MESRIFAILHANLINSRNRSGENTVVWKEMFTYQGLIPMLTISVVCCSLCQTSRVLEGSSCVPVNRRSQHRWHEVKIRQRTRAGGISREVFSIALWTVLWHKSSPAPVTTDLIVTAQPETAPNFTHPQQEAGIVSLRKIWKTNHSHWRHDKSLNGWHLFHGVWY